MAKAKKPLIQRVYGAIRLNKGLTMNMICGRFTSENRENVKWCVLELLDGHLIKYEMVKTAGIDRIHYKKS